MKKPSKKKIYLLLVILLDLLIALQLYDFYTQNYNKTFLAILAAAYVILRIYLFIRGIRRNKLKRKFNEMFPE